MKIPVPDHAKFLVERKYPQIKKPPHPMAYDFTSGEMDYNDIEEWVEPSQETIDKAQKYHNEIMILPKSELKRRYDEELEKKHYEDDKKRFFSKPEADADFDYWSKMPEWSLDETMALCFGKNPEIVTWSRIDRILSYTSPFVEKYLKLKELVVRTKRNNVFVDLKNAFSNDKIIPDKFVMWAKSNNIDFPKELADKVMELRGKGDDSLDFENKCQYIPPYLDFMLEAVQKINLSENERVQSEVIKKWLNDNWPDNLDGKSDRLISSMVTLLRRPKDKKGGNTPWKG